MLNRAHALAATPVLLVSNAHHRSLFRAVEHFSRRLRQLSCFWAKDIRTPNLDRLAAEGMKFTWFHAPCPVCTPSRAAILAGCYAQRVVYRTCSFHFSREGLHSNEVTIAELFMRGF